VSIISVGLLIVVSLAFIAIMIMSYRENGFIPTVPWAICLAIILWQHKYIVLIFAISSIIIIGLFLCATPKHK
jgi:predicted branched-subunit amino acid permease